MIAFAFVGFIYASVSGPTVLQSQSAGCREWHECQQMALEAESRRDFEAFHDLAWRAVQLGPRQDPTLMFTLARAQCLSGRPHDALVMLRRIAPSGVAGDALTSEDFRRTRDLPEWPDVQALIEGTAPAPKARPPSVARVSSSVPPPAPALAPPAPAAAVARPGAVDQSVRLTTGRFAAGGLAYDAVSRRFVVGDLLGRKLMVVGEGADHPVDLVRAESAGFQDVRAVEIDSRRGDLWVASATGDDWTIHRVQLVSGRPLKAIKVAADSAVLSLVDLAITSDGSVLAIDGAAGRLLALRPGRSSLEMILRLSDSGVTSLAATNDEDVLYVAHASGITRVDRRAKTVSPVTAAKGVQLGRIERIRWHRSALIAVQAGDDGVRRIVRFDLNRAGRTVTAATALDTAIPATAGPTFATIAGDELSYLIVADEASGPGSGGGAAGAPAQFIIRRVPLP